MIAFLKRLLLGDEFTRQARADQKRASAPGCELGLMRCLSQSCGCCERRPSRAFVKARAAHLRRGEPKVVNMKRAGFMGSWQIEYPDGEIVQGFGCAEDARSYIRRIQEGCR